MATSSSLFRNETSARGLAAARTSLPTVCLRASTAAVPDSTDARLIAILDAPLVRGETTTAGFARKEQELGAVFAALSLAEARELHARLATPRADDELANKLGRLTPDRRCRLVAFLADARRRAALAGRR